MDALDDVTNNEENEFDNDDADDDACDDARLVVMNALRKKSAAKQI